MKLRHTESFRSLLASVVPGSVLLAHSITLTASSPALAQELLPTGVEGYYTLPATPEGFDLDSSSEQERSRLRIPPAPDKMANPELYRAWHDMFSKKRVAAQLRQTNISHSPAKIKETKKTPAGIVSTSDPWSGYVITNPNNIFSQVGTTVYASFIQPKPISGCIVGPKDYHSAYWVGIDGYTDASIGISSNDVFQAGSELDFNCSTGINSYAWVEWYPAYQQQVTTLPIQPGDTVGVYVEVNSGAGGNPRYTTFISNNTNYVTIDLTPPIGIQLIGNAIEWIAERVTVSGKISNLTSFGFNGWFGVIATGFKPGGGILKYMPATFLQAAS
jgi:hypothetical protein